MKRILFCLVMLILLVVTERAEAREPNAQNTDSLEKRYGILVNTDEFPQKTPQQAIRSVIRATEIGESKYLLAQLIDPSAVDAKLAGDRDLLLQMAAQLKPAEAGEVIQQLNDHLDRGDWTIEDSQAFSRLPGVRDLSLERRGGRWFMHNVTVSRPTRTSSPLDR